jgi:hypothetical protein
MKTLPTLITTMALLGSLTLATANDDASRSEAQQHKMSGISFDEVDRDANGVVSRDEAQRYPKLHDRWRLLNDNRDPYIDRREFAAFELSPPLPDSGYGSEDHAAPDRSPAMDRPKAY